MENKERSRKGEKRTISKKNTNGLERGEKRPSRMGGPTAKTDPRFSLVARETSSGET